MPQTFGMNVIGYVSSNVSLGITARHFLRLFLAKGIPVSVYDVPFGSAAIARDDTYDHLAVKTAAELPYSVNVFFLSSAQMVSYLRNRPGGLCGDDQLNVGLIWFELTQMPSVIREGLALLDVLVAGSPYVRHIFATNVSGVLTVECKHPIFVPSGIEGDRSKFGLPEDRFLFVSSFDPHHDPMRKNPFGAIDAYLRAFDGHQREAGLVIKVNNAEVSTRGCDPQALVRELQERCKDRSDVWFIPRSLPYGDVLSLYASCDAFVSLHRAEGLGMGPLECMLLGKPVIATAWSGNMAYMKHTNSCLVGSDLVPYRGLGWRQFRRDGVELKWAEPRVEEAADWMRKLVRDPEFARGFGANGQRDARAYHEEALLAPFVDELKQLSEERGFLGGRQLKKAAQRARLEKAYLKERYRGWGGAKRWVLDGLDRRIFWRFRRDKAAAPESSQL